MTAVKSKQELFTNAFNGLASQGFRQSIVDKSCVYRHGKLRCAIGWNIAEGDYRRSLEGHRVTCDDVMEAAGINAGMLGFALTLQDIHDDYGTTPIKMREGMIKFAERHDLAVPPAIDVPLYCAPFATLARELEVA